MLAILVYPVIAVLSFWHFGDVGVTAAAVAIALTLNILFGFAVGWPAILFPAILFPAWRLAMTDPCENCDLILDAGMYSLAGAVAGAVAREVVRRIASEPRRPPSRAE
jgi:hypothetical protein